jgi:hypothetical protein
LPVPVAPTIAISGLLEPPKLADRGVWHRGQARMPVRPPQRGHAAWRGVIRHAGGGKAGRVFSAKPVSRTLASSTDGEQPSLPGEPRPAHWNHSWSASMRL